MEPFGLQTDIGRPSRSTASTNTRLTALGTSDLNSGTLKQPSSSEITLAFGMQVIFGLTSTPAGLCRSSSGGAISYISKGFGQY